ncbi:hypothetical protein TM57_17110 [Mycobacterium tuberculosis]|nr:hypothetical protein K651_00780 [Mycobacterium tuberculosis]ALE45174.1 hypothetical protein AA885_19245 [Mycobacterium tuberculosis variant bovis]AJW50821.1 hypothetical protein UB21_19450 [Mycobacterium tuberculosis]AMP26666.1 hypothetical protein UZ39_00770 [Mycobacterium tuberculosis]AOT76280.1 hypothetical protein TM57_17110 [Mycobacterium tuberculosis]
MPANRWDDVLGTLTPSFAIRCWLPTATALPKGRPRPTGRCWRAASSRRTGGVGAVARKAARATP